MKGYILAPLFCSYIYDDKTNAHTLGTRLGRWYKNGYFVSEKDYICIERADFVKYGICKATDNVPYQKVYLLSMSGVKKILDFELMKNRITKTTYNKALKKVEREIGKGSKEKDLEVKVKEKNLEVKEEKKVDQDVLVGLTEAVRDLNGTLSGLKMLIEKIWESDNKEKAEIEEVEEPEKEEEEKVVEFKKAPIPVSVDVLTQKKAEFYQRIDILLDVDTSLKNRSAALAWLYGKMNAVYGMVFDQIRKEAVSEYDSKHYSRVDLLCLSNTYYNIAINMIENRIDTCSRGKIGFDGGNKDRSRSRKVR